MQVEAPIAPDWWEGVPSASRGPFAGWHYPVRLPPLLRAHEAGPPPPGSATTTTAAGLFAKVADSFGCTRSKVQADATLVTWTPQVCRAQLPRQRAGRRLASPPPCTSPPPSCPPSPGGDSSSDDDDATAIEQARAAAAKRSRVGSWGHTHWWTTGPR